MKSPLTPAAVQLFSDLDDGCQAVLLNCMRAMAEASLGVKASMASIMTARQASAYRSLRRRDQAEIKRRIAAAGQ